MKTFPPCNHSGETRGMRKAAFAGRLFSWKLETTWALFFVPGRLERYRIYG
jgi:hypothetical protein